MRRAGFVSGWWLRWSRPETLPMSADGTRSRQCRGTRSSRATTGRITITRSTRRSTTRFGFNRCTPTKHSSPRRPRVRLRRRAPCPDCSPSCCRLLTYAITIGCVRSAPVLATLRDCCASAWALRASPHWTSTLRSRRPPVSDWPLWAITPPPSPPTAPMVSTQRALRSISRYLRAAPHPVGMARAG